jgi:hypothetical protein
MPGQAQAGHRDEAPAFQAHRRLDQGGNAGGRVEVANVALDGAQPQRRCALRAEHVAQCRDFNRVAQQGAGAMGFDHVQIVRPYIGHGEGFADHFHLAVDARRRESDLARAVVVDGRGAHDGAHRIAIPDRVRQTLEQDGAGAAARQRAVGSIVERAAVAAGRVDAAGLVHVPIALRQGERCAAGQRKVALAPEQGVHRMVQGH